MENTVDKRHVAYLRDCIGNEYQQWSRDALVMIKAPTGCGKTYFILHELLYNMAKIELNFKSKYEKEGVIENKYKSKILYLVNRKILKEQLLKECNEISLRLSLDYQKTINIADYISIYTYQEIESQIKCGNNDPLEFDEKDELSSLKRKREVNPFRYAVYDECHYFYTDSDFNPATVESYFYLTNNLYDTVQIFMSATIEHVSEGFEETWKMYHPSESYKIKKYVIPPNYDYVDLHYFVDETEIIELVKNGKNEKWLIFTDSIDKGNSLAADLRKIGDSFTGNQVVCINAGYKQDEEGRESVKELVEKDYIGKPVVIATSVLDNGVSFKDIELRNLIIMADTREEFIQMLGRKRVNGERVKVYICKRDKAYFSRRLQYVNSILECQKKYAESINAIFGPNGSYYQQIVLNALFSKENTYKKLKRFCYAVNGYIKRSFWAEQKLINLKSFYEQMAEAIEIDKNAFLKVQACWLEFPEEKIYSFITAETDRQSENVKRKLATVLEMVLDGKNEIVIISDDNKKYFKEEKRIRDLFIYFYEQDKENYERKIRKALDQTDHAIQPDVFNKCMSLAKLEYEMESVKKGVYIIKRK